MSKHAFLILEFLELLSLCFLKSLKTSCNMSGVGSIVSSIVSSIFSTFGAFFSFFFAFGFALASSSFFLASSSAFFFASCSANSFSGLFGWGGRIKVEVKYF